MKKIISTLCAMLLLAGAQGWFRQPTPNDTLRSTGDLPWDKPV